MLCESAVGYCWSFTIHCGECNYEDYFPVNPVKFQNLAMNYCIKVIQFTLIIGTGHQNSTNYFLKKISRNCKGYLEKYAQRPNKKKKKIPNRTIDYKSADNILCVKQHDKKELHLQSSLHFNADMVRTDNRDTVKSNRNNCCKTKLSN